MKNEIKTVFNQLLMVASDNHIKEGLEWYKSAHKQAKVLSKKHNISLVRTCGIISALSPNNKWERNLIDADLFLSKPDINTKVCTYKNQRYKALNIYKSGCKKTIPNILKGEKTKSFFYNIYNPEHNENVTVDLWIYRIAEVKESSKNYKILKEIISEMSNEIGVLPHELQAVLWCTYRDIYYRG